MKKDQGSSSPPDAVTEAPNHQLVDRRRFVISAAAGGAVALGALRNATVQNAFAASVRGGATATAPGVRGTATQVGPVLLPPAPSRPRTWRYGQWVTHVNTKTRMMAFTFDDGPSPWNTDNVLRTLDSFGIKATFFLIGVNVRAWPEIAKRTHEAGHELGNHTVYHTPYEPRALADQIGPNQEIIRAATGYTPVVNRAPSLARGQEILDACAQYGLYECHTAMPTNDWSYPRAPASQLYKEFTQGLKSGTFALYHDSNEPRPTVDALPHMIRFAQSNGYKCVTATELMLSGVPAPFTSTNQYLLSNEPEPADVPTQDSAGGSSILTDYNSCQTGVANVCNYDAAAGLRQMLNGDLPITYADRMRIVEALADLEAHAADR